MVLIRVPTPKLRSPSTRSCTMGSRQRNSRQRKAMSARTATAASQRIHSEPNQSTSCPLSSTSCREPTHRAIRAKPMMSTAPLACLR